MCETKTKTRFITVPITKSLTRGRSVGDGACLSVRLKLNVYNRNTTTRTGGAAVPYFIYYGDPQNQENELLAVVGVAASPNLGSTWSPKIKCTNLNQVWVRYAGTTADAGWPAIANVQVQIEEEA